MNRLITVIIPTFYEEEVIDQTYKRLTEVMSAYNYELIFVDDGSTDKTVEMLKEMAKKDSNVRMISFSKNFGHQAGITCGLKYAKGDAVVIIDSDLQDPPEVIPKMIDLWQKGNDVVYGKRIQRKGESFFKRITAKVFYRVLRMFSDTDIPEDTGDFRLMDRKVVNAFNSMKEYNRYIRGMVAWLGFTQVPVEYVRDERFAGDTKYTLKKMLQLSYNGLYSFSFTPIRFIKSLGVLTLIFALGLIIYAIISKVTQDIVAGWASLMIALSIFMGIQLISLGVVGDYVARTYDESRGRPIYLIDEMMNIDEE